VRLLLNASTGAAVTAPSLTPTAACTLVQLLPRERDVHERFRSGCSVQASARRGGLIRGRERGPPNN